MATLNIYDAGRCELARTQEYQSCTDLWSQVIDLCYKYGPDPQQLAAKLLHHRFDPDDETSTTMGKEDDRAFTSKNKRALSPLFTELYMKCSQQRYSEVRATVRKYLASI